MTTQLMANNCGRDTLTLLMQSDSKEWGWGTLYGPGVKLWLYWYKGHMDDGQHKVLQDLYD